MTVSTPSTSATARAVLAAYFTARPGLLGGAILATVAGGVAEVVFPWLLQQGVDTAVGGPGGWSLSDTGWAMLVAVLAIVLFHAASLIFETRLLSGGSFDLRKRIYSRIETLPYEAVTRHQTGNLAFRATHDVSQLEGFLSQLFGEGLFDLLVALGTLIAMAMTDLRLTLAVVAVMSVASVISNRAGERLPVIKRAEQMLAARLAGKLQETLAGIRTVRILRASSLLIARMDADNLAVRRLGARTGLVRSLITPLWNFAEALGIVVVLAYGGSLVANHVLSIGALVGFLAYQQLLAGPINRSGEYVYLWQACRGVAGRISSLIGDAPITSEGQGPRLQGDLVVDSVSFAYPRAEHPVFQDLSFTVRQGEHVAIVGRNGAGKSSLFDLLIGLRTPAAGRIRLETTDQAETPAQAWGRAFGLMPQETFLFRGSLADNLRLASPLASDEAMTAALVAAGGGELLARLDQGLATEVGERGQNLSGGERQLVGLARLILLDPPIVLLDEPTAHLDGAAQTAMLAGLARFCFGRTLLLISHDKDLLVLADRVILLDGGKVLDDGPPAQVARRSPLFAELMGPVGDLA